MPIASPNPWSAARPDLLWAETRQGNVAVWALGDARFSVRARGHEELVAG
jgi:hypothetical protein